MHGSNTVRLAQQINNRTAPGMLSFGGSNNNAFLNINDIQEDLQEFPEDPGSLTNKVANNTSNNLKNLGSYMGASYITNEPPPGGMIMRPPSILTAGGIDTIEKKLEKINSELAGDRESQKSLYSKLDQMRAEKEALMKENEKLKGSYEKRINSLKEELSNFNKIKLELEYKDQMYVNQKAFYEEEFNRMEEEKLELMQRLSTHDGAEKATTDILSEELWRGKYETLLSEMSNINLQIKLKDDKINSLLEELKRQADDNSLVVNNYEGKLNTLTQEVFRLKPDYDMLERLTQENEFLLKEMTEYKLKCIDAKTICHQNQC